MTLLMRIIWTFLMLMWSNWKSSAQKKGLLLSSSKTSSQNNFFCFSPSFASAYQLFGKRIVVFKDSPI